MSLFLIESYCIHLIFHHRNKIMLVLENIETIFLSPIKYFYKLRFAMRNNKKAKDEYFIINLLGTNFTSLAA